MFMSGPIWVGRSEPACDTDEIGEELRALEAEAIERADRPGLAKTRPSELPEAAATEAAAK